MKTANDILTFKNLSRIAGNTPTNRSFLVLKRHIDSETIPYERPFRSEVFCIVLCVRGKAEVSIDLNKYEIQCNALILIRPGTIFNLHVCRECEILCIVFSPEIRQHIPVPARDLADLQRKIIRNPVTYLTNEEKRQFYLVINVLHAFVDNDGSFCRFSMYHAIAMLLYVINTLLQRIAGKLPDSFRNRHDEYLYRFIQLLMQNYKNDRSVSFYADQLCLTPKYLSWVVRATSGKTASEWINETVVKEACYQLTTSEQSILQITYDLNFPNQSSFGKFFKSRTGVSPKNYRTLFRATEA